MVSTERLFLGVLVMILGIISFFGFATNTMFWFDNSAHEYTLYNASSNISSLNFDFDRTFINRYYDISDGKKVYLNYVNIYIDEFLDNTSIESIPTFMLNSNAFQPVNRTYEYSLQLEDEVLNRLNQQLLINQSGALTINKISISYIGINYSYYEYYITIIQILGIILFMIGILICL